MSTRSRYAFTLLIAVMLILLALCTSSVHAQSWSLTSHPLNQGLVGWWKSISPLVSATKWVDLTPWGNHGVPSGYSTAAGCGLLSSTRRGGTWRFASGTACSTTETITMPAGVYNFDRTDTFTVAVWVQTTSTRQQYFAFTNGGGSAQGWVLQFENGS